MEHNRYEAGCLELFHCACTCKSEESKVAKTASPRCQDIKFSVFYLVLPSCIVNHIIGGCVVNFEPIETC